ncbi:polysaccharide pyruvyl transferase family protein [Falsiroseomonas sp.]|uniref:polysaccharide pyruvyl transferase family protein n=1 Tax=Falsiroseomonas sp. TaxID=2870721 RepID=UPI0027365EF3|nr:polysaccharide pyruvyl transferase family protein [Falsiroseomonas sp.]MDP3415086.1 polysaccharide pyruvyl transferase family protein [Falsiroseomonas sp.]
MNLDVLAKVADFRAKLAELVNGDDYVFFDRPDYANTGDHLIWLGALAGLNSLGKRCIATYTAWQARTQPLPDFDVATTIICSGGGNFGDIYPNFQVAREILVRRYPNNRIIILPQTIYFKDGDIRSASENVMRQHQDLWIFGRDSGSRDLAKRFVSDGRALLAPDCAFFLYPFIQRTLYRMPLRQAKFEEVLLARTDGEKRLFPNRRNSSIVRFDWVGNIEWAASILGEAPKERLSAIELEIAPYFGEIDASSRLSLDYLCLGIEALSVGRNLVTDRLHGHILAAMMMKDHVFYDNSYGKNRGFFDTWTRSISFVEFSSD